MTKYRIEKLWQGRIIFTPCSQTLPDVRVRVDINGEMFSSGIHSNIVGAIHELLEKVKEKYPMAVRKLEKDIEYVDIPERRGVSPEPQKTAIFQEEPYVPSEVNVVTDLVRRAIEPVMKERGYVWVGSASEEKKGILAFKKDRFDLTEKAIIVKVEFP